MIIFIVLPKKKYCCFSDLEFLIQCQTRSSDVAVDAKVNPRKLTSETTIYYKENSAFAFPDAVKRPELRKKWIKFVNRKNWFPTEHSGDCSALFDLKSIKHGVRMTLIYDLNTIPIVYSNDAIKKFHFLCYYLFQIHQENLSISILHAK